MTAEEYEKCRDLCHSRGIDSVSGMARAAIHLLLQQPQAAESQTLEIRVSNLEGRLQIISLEIKRLHHLAGATPVPAATPQGNERSDPRRHNISNQIFAILLRRKWQTVGAFVLVVGAVTAFTLLTPKP